MTVGLLTSTLSEAAYNGCSGAMRSTRGGCTFILVVPHSSWCMCLAAQVTAKSFAENNHSAAQAVTAADSLLVNRCPQVMHSAGEYIEHTWMGTCETVACFSQACCKTVTHHIGTHKTSPVRQSVTRPQSGIPGACSFERQFSIHS